MERTFKKTADDTYPQKIFAHQLITVDDLQQFKKQLLEELLLALKKQTGVGPKKWLKSHELRRLLKISPGTLQTLKSSGVISLHQNWRCPFLRLRRYTKIVRSRKSKYKPGIKTALII